MPDADRHRAHRIALAPLKSGAFVRHAVRIVACYREEVSMAGSDITIEILKDIRRDVRGDNPARRVDG